MKRQDLYDSIAVLLTVAVLVASVFALLGIGAALIGVRP